MIRLKKRSAIVLAVLAAVAIGACVANGPDLLALMAFRPAAKPEKAAPLVSLTTVQTRDLPVKILAQGHLVPLNQVDVRPQRNGTIRGVHFKEGDDVEAGQLLFTLDAADSTAQFNRSQAQAAQIKAQLDDALRDYGRSKEMLKSRFISSGAVETSASKVEALQAQYRAALADVESVRVQVERTRILAPISGKAGAVKVYRGTLAQEGNANPLVTLVQFDPIGVEFNIPERHLAAVLAARAGNALTVSLQTGDGSEVEGRVTFLNNTVTANTGTISMKASLPNKTQALWPGAFARVTLGAGYSKGAIVLPPQAVIEGPAGHFVYVVTETSEVGIKPVTLLYIQDRQAVVEGLSGGERVVLEGSQNLRAGMKVRVMGKDARRADANGAGGAAS
ncbi:efflux RND transporter periplasmic adaptor subunit [Cupriavidus basilensis]|uniref:Efflux RND transporter periplasmic adaptor subunit n=1 Tax=Cupriavidus basilensis TaxID=68895 RepID=A0ABT6B4E5_9BURK|nr:efflux RND transporter periplasmic adaptor subunit [Cupriavidus basilensis]MDF3839746.1 efflux RND transporter periplasmic adaptor subunit [Cupriavidus basilensis]